jgi:hypothetical protein
MTTRQPSTDKHNMNLTTLSKLIIILFFLNVTQTTFGQTNDSYNFSLSGAYLPGGGGRREIYSKTKGKLEHKASESRLHGRHYKWKHKKRTLKNDLQIENTLNKLDSLFRLSEFKFTINKSIIDSIKAHNDRNKFYKIPLADIDKFFSHGDTVTLRLNDIKREDFEGTVIDGYPYFFELTIMRPNQDSIKYKFDGNFYDGVQTSNIKNWLPVYLAYGQSKFFDTMPMEEYFTNKNLESVLIRFIEWTK